MQKNDSFQIYERLYNLSYQSSLKWTWKKPLTEDTVLFQTEQNGPDVLQLATLSFIEKLTFFFFFSSYVFIRSSSFFVSLALTLLPP